MQSWFVSSFLSEPYSPSRPRHQPRPLNPKPSPQQEATRLACKDLLALLHTACGFHVSVPGLIKALDSAQVPPEPQTLKLTDVLKSGAHIHQDVLPYALC